MALLLPLGGLVGFFFGGILCVIVAILLGIALTLLAPFSFLATLLGLPALLGPVVVGLGPITALLLGLLAMFVVTAIAYAIAAVALLPVMAATPISLVAPTPLPPDPTELFVRGFIIGLGASVNFAFWAIVSGTPAVGLLAAFVTLVATIPGVSAFIGYQGVLGWLSWFLPMSHIFFVTPLGLLLFIIAAPFAVAASGIGALRFDVFTCTFETTGGAVITFLASISPAPFGGFNLGNFSFLNLPVTVPPTPLAAVQTGFLVPGLSAHETGHTLNVGVFGGAYHWVNAIDENIPPLARGPAAYGELTVESHFPRIGVQHVRVWS
jgi:hypothetical protein